MAEAMTRHTGEVDSYHFGPMAGLGTRHGVSHWGDGAKEARIGQAAFRRYYYYLTSDERTGDIMREALQADESVARYDPMRLADPPRPGDPKFPVRIRLGPDWLALAGNWMTEWERTGNTAYRDKILTGMKSIEAMPHGFRTGRILVVGLTRHRASSLREILRRERTTSPPSWAALNSCSSSISPSTTKPGRKSGWTFARTLAPRLVQASCRPTPTYLQRIPRSLKVPLRVFETVAVFARACRSSQFSDTYGRRNRHQRRFAEQPECHRGA